jgi:hypothetical protein
MVDLTINVTGEDVMKKQTVLMTLLSLAMAAFLLAGCAGMQTASESNFKNPTVTLSHAEVPYYTGYWYYAKAVAPTKGDANDNGAPMQMAFIFDIKNPNDYPVMLQSLKFSVLFEDFEVNTLTSQEAMWIPAGKTNQLRVPGMFDTRQTLLTLMLPGAMQLKAMGKTPWDFLEKWWKGAPDFSFPVSITEGAATFKADGVTKVSGFKAKYP